MIGPELILHNTFDFHANEAFPDNGILCEISLTNFNRRPYRFVDLTNPMLIFSPDCIQMVSVIPKLSGRFSIVLLIISYNAKISLIS